VGDARLNLRPPPHQSLRSNATLISVVNSLIDRITWFNDIISYTLYQVIVMKMGKDIYIASVTFHTHFLNHYNILLCDGIIVKKGSRFLLYKQLSYIYFISASW